MNLQTNLKEQLAKVLERADDLPGIPLTAMRILRMREDEGHAVEDLYKVLKSDQGMVAKLLRIVNSAYYGFPK